MVSQPQTMESIKMDTLKDVHLFICYLYDVRKVSFHPDDDFDNYVEAGTKGEVQTFTPDEVETHNRAMEKAFDICEANKVDLYGMCNVEYRLRFMEMFHSN